jgi:DNA processing protein
VRPDDYPFLIALTMTPRWANKNVNEFIEQVFVRSGLNPADFFTLPETEWWDRFGFHSDDVSVLSSVRDKAVTYHPLAVSLFIQGYEMCTFGEADFPPMLTENQRYKAPPLLYLRGSRNLLQRRGVAIVGRRNASERALRFAEAMASEAVRSGKAVVGGIEKEIDQRLMQKVIQMKGAYIGVLPQGILTFDHEPWEKPLNDGNLILVSSLHPKAQVSPVRSSSIHPLIYGLSERVYVAETSEFGRTWEGALEGLRIGFPVFVREPGIDEDNGNRTLIERGAQSTPFVDTPPPVEPVSELVISETAPAPDDDPDQLSWFDGADTTLPASEPALSEVEKPRVDDDQYTIFDLLGE